MLGNGVNKQKKKLQKEERSDKTKVICLRRKGRLDSVGNDQETVRRQKAVNTRSVKGDGRESRRSLGVF